MKKRRQKSQIKTETPSLVVSESTIQGRIITWLRRLPDCFAFKADVSLRGVPDVVCCYQGKFIAFEIKRQRGEATPIQLATFWLIQKAGGQAYIVNTLEQVQEIMKGLDDE
jgi:hypothetical protein